MRIKRFALTIAAVIAFAAAAYGAPDSVYATTSAIPCNSDATCSLLGSVRVKSVTINGIAGTSWYSWHGASDCTSDYYRPSGTTGCFLREKPNVAASGVTGLAASATTDTTNASNITSGTMPNARLSSVPNSSLANSSMTIAGHVVSLGGTQAISATDVGLGSVTNDTQTKAAIVPNTAPISGQFLVGNGTAYSPVTMSGACTLNSVGAITCPTPVIPVTRLPLVATNPTFGLVAGSSDGSGPIYNCMLAAAAVGTYCEVPAGSYSWTTTKRISTANMWVNLNCGATITWTGAPDGLFFISDPGSTGLRLTGCGTWNAAGDTENYATRIVGDVNDGLVIQGIGGRLTLTKCYSSCVLDAVKGANDIIIDNVDITDFAIGAASTPWNQAVFMKVPAGVTYRAPRITNSRFISKRADGVRRIAVQLWAENNINGTWEGFVSQGNRYETVLQNPAAFDCNLCIIHAANGFLVDNDLFFGAGINFDGLGVTTEQPTYSQQISNTRISGYGTTGIELSRGQNVSISGVIVDGVGSPVTNHSGIYIDAPAYNNIAMSGVVVKNVVGDGAIIVHAEHEVRGLSVAGLVAEIQSGPCISFESPVRNAAIQGTCHNKTGAGVALSLIDTNNSTLDLAVNGFAALGALEASTVDVGSNSITGSITATSPTFTVTSGAHTVLSTNRVCMAGLDRSGYSYCWRDVANDVIDAWGSATDPNGNLSAGRGSTAIRTGSALSTKTTAGVNTTWP